ncbi:MAG TPA: four helix bundle protein [Gemmatimonadaceae bacterium]|jgi:four helix bundle protein
MQDFKRLRVWQDGRALTVAIDEATRSIRPGDAPNLRSQLMRASMSISATVAEGAGRETRVDFARFVSMAIASASEVEHHLEVCDDLGLIERAELDRLVDRVTRLRRMLFGLRRTLLVKEREEAVRRDQASRQRRRHPPLAD